MFKVGDLVMRVKKLSFGDESSFEWMVDHTVSDDVGIVLEVEMPEFDIQIYNLEYPECFVKVLWQNAEQAAMNPLWHWGEELELYKKSS
jgi:hypothetical protein